MHYLLLTVFTLLQLIFFPTTASPMALRLRQDDSSYESLSQQCVFGGNNDACKQLGWSSDLVSYYRNPPSSQDTSEDDPAQGQVGSSIRPFNSTAPPSVAAELAGKRDTNLSPSRRIWKRDTTTSTTTSTTNAAGAQSVTCEGSPDGVTDLCTLPAGFTNSNYPASIGASQDESDNGDSSSVPRKRDGDSDTTVEIQSLDVEENSGTFFRRSR